MGQKKSYYSFDSGKFHFIVLDSCFRSDGQPYGRKNFEWTDPNIPAAEVDWSAVGRRYVEALPVTPGDGLLVTDKMPLNFRYLGLVKAALPGAHGGSHPDGGQKRARCQAA